MVRHDTRTYLSSTNNRVPTEACLQLRYREDLKLLNMRLQREENWIRIDTNCRNVVALNTHLSRKASQTRLEPCPPSPGPTMTTVLYIDHERTATLPNTTQVVIRTSYSKDVIHLRSAVINPNWDGTVPFQLFPSTSKWATVEVMWVLNRVGTFEKELTQVRQPTNLSRDTTSESIVATEKGNYHRSKQGSTSEPSASKDM